MSGLIFSFLPYLWTLYLLCVTLHIVCNIKFFFWMSASSFVGYSPVERTQKTELTRWEVSLHVLKAFNSQLLLRESTLAHVVSVKGKPRNSNKGEMEVRKILWPFKPAKPFQKHCPSSKPDCLEAEKQAVFSYFLSSWHFGGRGLRLRALWLRNADLPDLRAAAFVSHQNISAGGATVLSSGEALAPFIVPGCSRSD